MGNLSAILQDFYHGQYAPINQLYYTTIYSLFGYNAAAFHFAGIFFHVLNVVAVYCFIKKLCSTAFGKGLEESSNIAFISAAIFGLHPVNAEPAAWIAASKILIYSFFYLLSLIAYLDYIVSKKNYSYYLCMLCFIFSFGAKEQAVTLPLCMLLLDYICCRNMKEEIIWYEKLPYIILAIYFGLLSVSSQEIDPGTKFHYTYSITERFALAGYTFMEYLTKCTLPAKISYLYPFPFEPGEIIPVWLFIYPFFLSLCIYFLKDYLVRKWLQFGFLFFFIHVGIVLNLLNLSRYAVVADRYAYLSSIGICFIFAFAYQTALKKGHYLKQLWNILFISLLIGFGLYSHFHLNVWKNTVSLKKSFRDTILQRKDFNEIKKNLKNKND
ncbi:hypothetical protein [Pedobacter sp. UBA5917]|uniref:hypothetical protein n=1 Tax=Pedobacter sp. UBA5917 TaxID=1947061 RepID=UPI0025E27715|nr:hypothetical protein [Pedobacter sp. UBA5917]